MQHAASGSHRPSRSLVQARNNARVVVSGSMDLFGNRFFNADVKDREGKGWVRGGREGGRGMLRPCKECLVCGEVLCHTVVGSGGGVGEET